MDAVLATDADIRIDDNDAVFLAFPGRPGGTDIDTVGMTAVIAQPGQEASAYVRVVALFNVFHPGPGLAQGNVEFGLAGDAAGVDAETAPDVDEHSVLHPAFRFGGLSGTREGGREDGGGRASTDLPDHVPAGDWVT